jgi:type I restriction enzyme S subunit
VPNRERNHGMKEKTVLSLSYGRIVIKPAEKLHGLVPESFETYQIVNPGDSRPSHHRCFRMTTPASV